MACNSNHDFSEAFCINERCPLFGKPGQGNIRLQGHTGKDKSIHELSCHKCGKSFSERSGTPLFMGRLGEERVLSVVQHLLEGNGVRGTARLVGVHRDTVVRYLRLAGSHVLAVMNVLLINLGCQEIQLDEFWAFVNKKEKNASPREKLENGYGDRWIHLAMDAASRLIVACAIGRRTQMTTDVIVAEVARRLADPADALYTSDEHEPYLVAMARLARSLESASLDTSRPAALDAALDAAEEAGEGSSAGTGGAVQPAGTSEADPSLTLESAARPGFVYATVRKERRENRVVKVHRTLQIGSQEDLDRRLDASPVSQKVNTSFIERLNNTERQMGRRVGRKTMGFSKTPDLLDSQIHLQTAYYNLVRPHRALEAVVEIDERRSVRKQRTPAMAAGIEDHPWTLQELLRFRIPPQIGASEAA